VVIIGGGEVGFEIAYFVTTQDNRVRVIEKISEVGCDLEVSTTSVKLLAQSE